MPEAAESPDGVGTGRLGTGRVGTERGDPGAGTRGFDDGLEPVIAVQEVDERTQTVPVVHVAPLEIRGYKLLERLGSGTMGTVYKAVQLAMDRLVAIKILPASMTSDQNFVARFIQEARAAGKLNHPNLIRIHEVNKSGQYHYYSMEYVDGMDLGSLIERYEVLQAGRVLRIMGQVVRALDYGHQYGFVHGEIRPQAILVSRRGDRTKLADLGITKIGGRARYIIGKNAYYVAPEQAADGIIDIRTDFYCLACCLFHAVTGEPPFVGKTPQEILSKHVTADPPDPRDVNPRVPDGLARTLVRMLQKNPQERFTNPAELLRGMRGGGR
jgi:serine/threonine-protein kinase